MHTGFHLILTEQVLKGFMSHPEMAVELNQTKTRCFSLASYLLFILLAGPGYRTIFPQNKY